MSNVSSSIDVLQPTPKPGWGPVAAIILTIIGFFISQFLAAFLLTLVLALFGGKDVSGPEWLDTILGQFGFVLMSDVFALVIIGWYVRRKQPGGLRAASRLIGFSRQPRWHDLGYAALGFVVYFGLLLVVTTILVLATGLDTSQAQELGFENLLGIDDKLLAFVSLVLLPSLVEEVIFRGFLYTGLRKRLTFVWATIITSLLFAAPHLLASSEGPLWIAGVDTLVLSGVLCYLREKTGSLWAPIGVHAVKNSIAFVFLLMPATVL
jgi:membrane protease YdiL (CAAX protease family)